MLEKGQKRAQGVGIVWLAGSTDPMLTDILSSGSRTHGTKQILLLVGLKALDFSITWSDFL